MRERKIVKNFYGKGRVEEKRERVWNGGGVVGVVQTVWYEVEKGRDMYEGGGMRSLGITYLRGKRSG